jgi:hypothetical protein
MKITFYGKAGYIYFTKRHSIKTFFMGRVSCARQWFLCGIIFYRREAAFICEGVAET